MEKAVRDGAVSLARIVRSELKLKHLQLLVAIGDFHHLGQASEFLHLTQPAASRTLADIEDSFGVPLFTRSSRGTIQTPYGERVLRYARQVLTELDRVQDDLRTLQAGAEGRVTIGASMIAALMLLPRAIAALKQEWPQATVRVEEGATNLLLPKLTLGELDLVVGRMDPASANSDVLVESLYQESNAVVVSPSHPLARRKRVSWKEAIDFPWVLLLPGMLPRVALEQTLARHALPLPGDVVETSSFVSVIACLRERSSMALLPASIACEYSKSGLLTIIPLVLAEVPLTIGLARLKSRPAAPLAQRLAQTLRDSAANVKADSGTAVA